MKKFFNKLLKNYDLFKGKANGFTLAETLITLGIIGIVAAVTIPTLMKNYQNYVWNKSARIFQLKLLEALKIMNINDTLAGKSNTGEFLNELGKNFKIAKICNTDNLEQCFANTITAEILNYDSENLKGNTTFLLNDIKSKNTLRNTSYSTGVNGVVFVNGVTALVEYNPNCKHNKYDNQFNGFDCIAILYDINGNKAPNTVGKDIVSINAKTSGAIKINGKIFTEPKPINTYISYDECMQIKDTLGINSCSAYEKDYWGAAVKECGGISKMPTNNDLLILAQKLYPWDEMIAEDHTTSGIFYLCPNNKNCLEKKNAERFLAASSNNDSFVIWSNVDSPQYPGRRNFYSYITHATNNNRDNSTPTVLLCIE